MRSTFGQLQARLKQEGPVSPVPTAVVSARTPRSAEHGQMVHPRADSASNPLRVGEAVSPWTRHQERAHRLSACLEQPSVRGHYIGEGVPCIQCVLRMMTIINLVSTLNLTWLHMNLVWFTQA